MDDADAAFDAAFVELGRLITMPAALLAALKTAEMDFRIVRIPIFGLTAFHVRETSLVIRATFADAAARVA